MLTLLTHTDTETDTTPSCDGGGMARARSRSSLKENKSGGQDTKCHRSVSQERRRWHSLGSLQYVVVMFRDKSEIVVAAAFCDSQPLRSQKAMASCLESNLTSTLDSGSALQKQTNKHQKTEEMQGFVCRLGQQRLCEGLRSQKFMCFLM